jgi:hypothetical protein
MKSNFGEMQSMWNKIKSWFKNSTTILWARTGFRRARRGFADGARVRPECEQRNSVGAAAKVYSVLRDHCRTH